MSRLRKPWSDVASTRMPSIAGDGSDTTTTSPLVRPEAITAMSPALRIVAETGSPILGQGGNREFLWLLVPVGG